MALCNRPRFTHSIPSFLSTTLSFSSTTSKYSVTALGWNGHHDHINLCLGSVMGEWFLLSQQV